MSSINFDNPWLLFIAVPLVILFTVPFFIAVCRDNANGHNIASGVIHIVMAIIIAFVAAGTSVITTVTQTDVYVLADVSYSANRNLDLVDDYIADLGKSLPNNSRMGVICFGRDYQLVTRLGEKVKSVKTAEVDDSATDIIGALDYAGSLFRDDVIKRIVLITDGKQTNESDSNALKRQVDALADRRIHVDAIYLDDNLRSDAEEVQLSDVQFTQTTCLNREENVLITIDCSNPAVDDDGKPKTVEAVLTLNLDGEKYSEKTVYLINGKNSESFSLATDEAGTYDYEVVISCDADENLLNNKLTFSQIVSDEMKVLLITNTADDYISLVDSYGENAEVDAYFSTDYNIPCSVEELCVYDEIVISNVDLYKIRNRDSFLQSLDMVVSSFGKSLVTFGDMFVQSYSSGELKQLGEMLPVNYGKNSDAPKLYTLVIDTSRSMEYFVGNLDRAKRAASEIVNMLSDNDMVAVVEFNGDAQPYNAKPLSSDRQTVLDLIAGFEVRQGTDMGLGLEAAFNMMKAGNYSEKRVMLITDGINYSSTDGNVSKLVQEMRSNGIYVSTLDVGRGNSIDAGYSTALKRLAVVGGGVYLDISTEANLEDVIKNDLPNDLNDLEGGMSYITVKRPNDEVIKDIATEISQSFVRNYLYSEAKGNATTVLTVRYNRGTSQDDAPLYSYWNYGNGKVASFASSLSGEWINLMNTDLRNRLFRNIFAVNTPVEKNAYPFVLDIESSEGYASVTLTPETMRNSSEATISITAPDGTVMEGNLAFGPLSFNYNFVTPDVGKYVITVKYMPYNQPDSEDASIVGYETTRIIDVSYSSEYDSFALYDAAVLHKAIGTNGTVSEDGKLKIVNDENEIGLYNLSLAVPLLIVCVVLYAIDIAVRKLKWEDVKSFFKKGKRVK